MTINGGGHTIRMDGDELSIISGPRAILNLNNVTINGNFKSHAGGAIRAGTLTANNVSFTNNGGGTMILANQATLTNVYFAGNRNRPLSLGGTASAIQANANTSHTLTNAVFRNNFGGGGAVLLQTGATFTTNGCLTLSGNIPYDIYEGSGTWTDNSTGACSGTIGNGSQAAIAAPALMACGFPAAGNLDVSATYTLTADCALTGAYDISEDVSIRIISNGRSIRSSRTGYSFFTAATSRLQLENVALEGIRFYNWGIFSAERVKVSATNGGVLLNLGEARVTNALFEDNATASAGGRSVMLTWNSYQSGFASFTDVAFRNNSGGLGVLATFGATIELNGCINFENNSPVDTYVYPGRGGVVTDNRDPNCDTTIINPVTLVTPNQPPSDDSSDDSEDLYNPQGAGQPVPGQENCNIKLGAIGIICRSGGQPPAAEVWRIRPNREGANLPAVGTFVLAVDQPQVQAVAEGFVTCSDDGRVAVRAGLSAEIRHIFELSPKYAAQLKIPRRYIVFSKGPTFEGKTHHVVLENTLEGQVFGIVTTIGDEPPASDCVKRQPAEHVSQARALPTSAPVYAQPVQPKPPQPDGSIIHVVQPGDTISAIAVAYRTHQLEIIMANQLEHMGRWIYPGQRLIIREAGG
ncbi:MAG: LysM domain-containing protein [Chloroflexi bacterium]|nr:LysM domain-containing protein [Chloroflexota bacterium]